MKVSFISLGCAKNTVNAEQMMALCRDAGMELLSAPEGADVVVINTCGFIDSAKSEAIDNILAMAELKAEGRIGKILVTGCLSQRYKEEILTELPEVDGILGTGSYSEIVSAIEEVTAGGVPCRFGSIHAPVEELDRVLTTPPYTAYLRIAEGCDNHCAYCVIPSLRGKYRSRSMENVLAEAQKLSDSGVKELIIIAQDITRYGIDLYGAKKLSALLRELCKMDFRWIRLHYLYPDEIDDELIDTIAEKYNADPGHIALTGLSMGGYGTWDLATAFPDYFSAIAPICGGGITWRCGLIAHLPIRAFHSEHEQIVISENSKMMVAAVNACGGSATLTLYDSNDHNCWDETYRNTDIIPWLMTATWRK